jgi:hypothetical protein
MSVTNNAMLASLTISGWSGNKLDKQVTQDVASQHGASSDAGTYSKRLVAKDALAEIRKITTEARAQHHHYTLPWAQDGARILPSAIYAKYAAEMRGMQDRYELAVKNFVAVYESEKELAKTRLGGMFNDGDYPDVAEIEGKFAWDISIMPIPSSNDFRVNMSEDMAAAIRQDIEAKGNKAMQEATRSLFDRVVKTVSHMAQSLEEYGEVIDENGKVKKINPFRDTLVTNVQDLVDLLPTLNITGDNGLTTIIEEIKKRLLTKTPDELRSMPLVRQEVARNARKVLEDMEGYV